MNDVISALSDKFSEELEAGLTEDCMKRVKKHIEDMLYDVETDIEWRMKENLQATLTSYVQEMANKAIEAMLRGDVGQMTHHLRCAPGYYNGRDRDTWIGPVIHGKLSEYDPLLLRKQIVEAHADLLKNERVLDLESQVASLVKQVNLLEAQNDRLQARFRELS